MDEPNTIKITLKSGSSSEGKSVEIIETATVKDLRAMVVEAFKPDNASITPASVVLIFGGQILKDEKIIKDTSIKNGHKVHVVLKKAPATTSASKVTTNRTPATSRPVAPTNTAATSNPTPTTQARAGQQAAGAGMAGLADMLGGNMGGQNMEQMQQELLNNPEMLNQIMRNPLMQSVMSDPAVMREMINANPQLRRLMDSQPHVRHMLENPETLRSMMDMARNPARMQEMMRQQDQAMQHLESLPGGSAHLQNMYQNVVQPMQDAASVNPFEQLANANEGNGSTTENTQSNTETTSALPNPWAAQQNTNGNGNPSQPGGAQLTDGLRNAMMNSILNNVPGGGNIPEEARQRMAGLFGNPAAMQAMQRPSVREAMQQIQRGVATISREAPELAELMGLPQMPNMDVMGGMGGAGGPLGGFGGAMGGGAPAAAAATPAAPADTRPPEERWATQLEQLGAMGFTNREQNIRALQSSAGNVNIAIERLLGGNMPFM